MRYLFLYDHEAFDKYAEDHANAVLNIAAVLYYLAQKSQTVADLSRKINTPERKEQNRSVYDLYAVVRRLEKWGYIQKEKNCKKHNSEFWFCVLTPQGEELLSIMPRYLLRGAHQYYEMYQNKCGYGAKKQRKCSRFFRLLLR